MHSGRHQVYIPTKKGKNPFLDEIMNHSQFNFTFGDTQSYQEKFPIVLINWPEQLFGWNEPSIEELKELEKKINTWKKTARLIYVVHNLKPHKLKSKKYDQLYDLVQNNADIMIHFGEYSRTLFIDRYKECQHHMIPHPLYDKSMTIHGKKAARKMLKLKETDTIIIVPGAIRNVHEKNTIYKAFDNLSITNKKIIIMRMLRKDLNIDFPGRQRLKKYIDVKKVLIEFCSTRFKRNYITKFDFVKNDTLSIYLSAADIVFIPRIDTLNSGLLFLALTFKKMVVGPRIGNIREYLENFNFPSFNPNDDNSISEALSEAAERNANFSIANEALDNLKSKNIAKQWDKLLLGII